LRRHDIARDRSHDHRIDEFSSSTSPLHRRKSSMSDLLGVEVKQLSRNVTAAHLREIFTSAGSPTIVLLHIVRFHRAHVVARRGLRRVCHSSPTRASPPPSSTVPLSMAWPFFALLLLVVLSVTAVRVTAIRSVVRHSGALLAVSVLPARTMFRFKHTTIFNNNNNNTTIISYNNNIFHHHIFITQPSSPLMRHLIRREDAAHLAPRTRRDART
jgi:hypothetical protein